MACSGTVAQSSVLLRIFFEVAFALSRVSDINFRRGHKRLAHPLETLFRNVARPAGDHLAGESTTHVRPYHASILIHIATFTCQSMGPTQASKPFILLTTF